MASKGLEHEDVRLPLISKLESLGWKSEQMLYSPEWRVPKTPSEATKREKGQSFHGFPVDLVIFDEPDNRGSWQHVAILFETKEPKEKAGLSQLQRVMSCEPTAMLGVWTNGASVTRVRRTADGKFKVERDVDLPRPGEELIIPGASRLTWEDLSPADSRSLRTTFERLLDHVVASDTKSTRRDDQLNQLCNLLLTKLESDRRAKSEPDKPVKFQVWGTDDAETGTVVRKQYEQLRLTHGDVFTAPQDRALHLDDSTIQKACYALGSIRLLDTDIDVISAAFQVYRAASLKSEEGQYFTPEPIIRHAVTLMEVEYDDVIIDPACGTGGFLIETFRQFQQRYSHLSDSDRKSWAQAHLYGVDKDAINVKLTKAMMMILGDGSAHTFQGDSLSSHKWPKNFPHLVPVLSDERYTCIMTNPPFGQNLKLGAREGELSNLEVSRKFRKQKNGSYAATGTYQARELGIVFVERCHALLVPGGRLAIILPETYFFSSSYLWFQEWIRRHFIVRGIFNVPMEAFQGFCRAKTNLYVFEKRKES